MGHPSFYFLEKFNDRFVLYLVAFCATSIDSRI
jgi:hypothetical protein